MFLPDPIRFRGTASEQAIGQWGQLAEPTATAFYTATTAEDFTAGEDRHSDAEQPAVDQGPVDINILLAAALGACECWGLQADCGLCQGQGSAGWTQPEPELFDEFVRPAIARLPGIYADGSRSPTPAVTADEDNQDHQTAQGVDA